MFPLKVIEKCNLQGQPDSIALDKMGRNIVVVLENQRDEALNKGAIPQLPAGNVTILPIKNGVPDCTGAHPIDPRDTIILTPLSDGVFPLVHHVEGDVKGGGGGRRLIICRADRSRPWRPRALDSRATSSASCRSRSRSRARWSAITASTRR